MVRVEGEGEEGLWREGERRKGSWRGRGPPCRVVATGRWGEEELGMKGRRIDER